MIKLKHRAFWLHFTLSLLLLRTLVSLGAFLNFALAQDLALAQTTEESVNQEKTWYTCGMHPEVIEDHPGNCPKCGMKLLPMSSDRAESLGLSSGAVVKEDIKEKKVSYWKSPMVPGEIHDAPGKDSMGHELVPVYEGESSSAGTIRISPVVEQNMGVRTAIVKRGTVNKMVRTVGIVSYDETSLTAVASKVNGWIEKLYVERTGDQVHQGDKLFELYSPQLFSAQEEYLSALRSAKGVGGLTASSLGRNDTRSLVSDARTRLEYFDISQDQIRDLERAGKPQKTLTIQAPSTGIVINKNVVQGQMIKAGEDLFRIADLSSVWVIAKIFESDLPFIKVGEPALMSLSYLPGKIFRGYVRYIYPFLDEKTREVSVRIEFHNPGYELKPGMFTTVRISNQLKENAVLVPDLAVIDTGMRKVVFVTAEPGQFQLRNVSIGSRSDNNYLEVLSGLAEGERVVISGQFLLDSESRLREAALKFLKPSGADGPNPAEIESSPAEPSLKPESRIYYACPMPEHVDTLYEKAGKCPVCGMEMVPVPNPVKLEAPQSETQPKEPNHEH